MQGESDGAAARRRMPPEPQLEYRERLRTPLWWYPVGLLVAVILAAEFQLSGNALIQWLPFVALPALTIVVVWSLGRARLAISADELSIRGAHVPLHFVSGVVALDARTLRRLIGREGDPRAYVSIRPWIGPGVQLQLDDPDDPTPYWVISTRHPDQVVALLRADS